MIISRPRMPRGVALRWGRLLLVLTSCTLGAGPLGCGDSVEDGSGGAASSSGGNGGDDGDGRDGSSVSIVATATVVTSTSTGPATCSDAAQCDDQNPCTEDACGEDGRCVSTVDAVDDGDRCTIDACDPLEGETHEPYVADDGDACTMDVCSPVLGTAFLGDVVLFQDSFADEETEWAAEAPWAIGPAEPSATNALGMADPASDYSAGDDDRIAGVVLGGSPSPDAEGAVYLESPEFDADVDGSIALEYRRWLGEQTENEPTVEVWDGSSWVVVWEAPRDVADAPPRGEGWVRAQHDVTALRSATMRVRFGVALGGTSPSPSWNVDDILVIRRGWPVDDDACTTDSCNSASGPRHVAIAIDDDDDCTIDVCHPVTGVDHDPDPDCATGTGGASGQGTGSAGGTTTAGGTGGA